MMGRSNPLWLYSGSDKYIQGIRSDRESGKKIMDEGLRYCTGSTDQTILMKNKQTNKQTTQERKMIVWQGLTNS